MQRATPPSASVEKALALFGLIARDHGVTAMKELASGLDLPRSTLHRLLGSLAGAGLITRVSHGVYDVGLPLVETLNTISLAAHLARLSRPDLQILADRCGGTAHLGILENDMVTYLVKAQGKGAEPVFTRENAQLEAYCSGIGKILLAALPEEARDRYLAAGPFVPLTDKTITDGDALRQALAHVARQDFAADDGEVAEDLFCLAVPVRRRDGLVHAAISLSFKKAAVGVRHIGTDLDNLRLCAARIRAKLN